MRIPALLSLEAEMRLEGELPFRLHVPPSEPVITIDPHCPHAQMQDLIHEVSDMHQMSLEDQRLGYILRRLCAIHNQMGESR